MFSLFKFLIRHPLLNVTDASMTNLETINGMVMEHSFLQMGINMKEHHRKIIYRLFSLKFNPLSVEDEIKKYI
jgi:hypothetical protein